MVCKSLFEHLLSAGAVKGRAARGLARKLEIVLVVTGGTRWRIWLRHCATSRNVASSIPDDVIILPATLSVGSTQPIAEMSTRGISWG